MTWPRKAKPKVEVQDRVKVKSPLDGLIVEEVVAPVSPFGGPAVVDPFAGPAKVDPFAGVPTASTAFMGEVAAKATEDFGPRASMDFAAKASMDFGPKASRDFGAKATNAFAAKASRKGGLVSVTRRLLLPPPREDKPRPQIRYWMPWCAWLDCFRDGHRLLDSVFLPGGGIDFDEARLSSGYRCVENAFEAGDSPEPGHEPASSDEYFCPSPQHYLMASEFDDIEEMLRVVCDHEVYFDAHIEWADARKYLGAMRQAALQNVEYLSEMPLNLDYYYMLAGYELEDLPADLRRGLIEAVNSGVHDRGVAAAWADYIARDYSTLFGNAGKRVDALIAAARSRNTWMPEQPETFLVFEDLAQPVDIEVSWKDRHYARIKGDYVVQRIEYYSALDRPMIHTAGFAGWRVLYMVPWKRSMGRLVEFAV